MLSQYPYNWKQISHSVKQMANFRCEFCGAPEGAVVYRKFITKSIELWPGKNFAYKPWSIFDNGTEPIKIRLQVAHIGYPLANGHAGNKHNKTDCRRNNLRALCQACHLNLDRLDHNKFKKHKKILDQIKAGQVVLL